MTEQKGSPRPAMSDPFGFWKQVYEMSEEAWSRILQDVMSTDAFASALGKYMEGVLVLQKQTREGVEKYLEMMNFPTRPDISRVAGQVVALEAKVDDLAEKVDAVAEAIAAGAKEVKQVSKACSAIAPATRAALEAALAELPSRRQVEELERKLEEVAARLDAIGKQPLPT